MSARITSTSVIFGDNSSLSSFYGIIPKGVVTFFPQSFTPLGWTLITTQNDKALRVVSGTGGGQGGNRNFSDLFSPVSISSPTTLTGSIGATSLSLSQIGNHSHPTPDGNTVQGGGFNIAAGRGFSIFGSGYTTGNGSGQGLAGLSHGHPFTNQNISYSHTFDFNVNYVDVILAKFN